MEMSDYLDVVAPYAQAIYSRYLTAALVEMSRLEASQVRQVGRKLPLSKRIHKILADHVSGKVKDFKKRWDNFEPEQQETIESKAGPFPNVGLKHVPDEIAVPYSARDADATFRLRPALVPRVTALGLDAICDLDHAVLPMIDRMQQVGMMVDSAYLRDLGIVLDQEMQMLREDLRGLTSNPAYNPASGDQLAEVLFGHFGLNPVKLTKGKKRPAVDSKVLEELLITYQDSPFVMDFIQLNQEFTERLKLKGTYVDNLEKFTASDGRIHPSLRTTRVVSGRLSSHDPNLLAIPVRTALGRLVRGGFVAPPGRQLGSWDLDQIEMRVLAHESGDPAMVEVLSDPSRHIHKETTYRIYGIPVEAVDKNSTEYMMSKNISFGIMYGITAEGLRAQMAQRGQHRTKEECQGMIDAYLDTAYPGVKEYMDKCRCDAIKQGFVRTLLGRIRYIPGIKSSIRAVRSEAERAAGNHPIQGGASDIVKLWMRQLWPKIHGGLAAYALAEPLLQVHDELILEFDEGNFDVVDYMVREALREAVEPLHLRVPISCGGKAAQNWGELK
jgi:DNA polymerase-1